MCLPFISFYIFLRKFFYVAPCYSPFCVCILSFVTTKTTSSWMKKSSFCGNTAKKFFNEIPTFLLLLYSMFEYEGKEDFFPFVLSCFNSYIKVYIILKWFFFFLYFNLLVPFMYELSYDLNNRGICSKIMKCERSNDFLKILWYLWLFIVVRSHL